MNDIVTKAAKDEVCCDATLPSGNKCSYLPIEGSIYCQYHGGRRRADLATAKRESIYDWTQTKYLQSIEQGIHRSSRSTSLKEELGMVRILLQTLIETFEDKNAAFLKSGEILALVSKIESIAKTTHTIDKELGELVSRDEAKEIGSKMLQVLVDNLTVFVNDKNDEIRASGAPIPPFEIDDLLSTIAAGMGEILLERNQ